MSKLERLLYNHSLPESFFKIPPAVYKELEFSNEENPAVLKSLFRAEAERNEIIIYTDHAHVRLVGIFPHHSPEAQFGFWETSNDLNLSQEAFGMLEQDAFKRNRQVITGPINFNTFHRYRLRLGQMPSWKVFDREPVNPSYYPLLLEQLGFTIKSYFESRLIRKASVPEVYLDKQLYVSALKELPYEFIPLTPEIWKRYEDEIFQLVLEVFGANPAFKPISRHQFNLLYNESFAQKLCPHTSVLFRDKATDKFVAMSFCHPNYKELNLPEAQLPTFASDYPKLQHRVMLAKSVGVHPAYRKQGLMTYLGAYGMLNFKEYYDEALFCLMRSDNYSLHFTDGLPYESAQYALFEKVLTA